MPENGTSQPHKDRREAWGGLGHLVQLKTKHVIGLQETNLVSLRQKSDRIRLHPSDNATFAGPLILFPSVPEPKWLQPIKDQSTA